MKRLIAFLGASAALLLPFPSALADEAAAPVEAVAAKAPAAVSAVDAKWASADADQVRAEINSVGELIRQKIGESMALQQQVNASGENPAYTSEAIEKMRLEIKAMEKALVQAKINLQAEVAKHPDVVEMSQKNRAILDEVVALRKRKKAFAQLLAERLSGKTGGR